MALIKTIDELRQFLRIPASNISSKMPAIEGAEERYLIPIIGTALYMRLQEAYDGNDLTQPLTDLLKKCRTVIAPMAYLNDLPLLQANLSDNGIRVNQTENTRSAFKWEYTQAKESLTQNGYSAMEMLIIYLKEHRVDFPEWDSAPYNDPELVCILRDGSDLRRCISLQQPHRCFLMLQPLLPMLSDMYLKPSIGDEFYTHFNQRIIAGDLSAEEKALSNLLIPAMARLSMMQAAVELSIRFSGSGFTIADVLTDLTDDSRRDADAEKLNRFRIEMERTGDAYLTKAKDYLIKNADNDAFALFKNSDAYPKDGLPLHQQSNCRRKGIFVT